MREHRLEVADVFREHTEEFLELWGHTVSSQQRKALRDIGACRTAALGGHVEECDQCAHRLIAYNSCRNRHCPKCQSTARDQWLAERAKELLPVPYCHVVYHPRTACATSIAEPAGLLPFVVPGGVRDVPANRCRSPASRSQDRLSGCTAHLEPEP